MKARALGDTELAETLYALIIDRQAETVKNDRARKNILWRKPFGEDYYDKGSPLTKRQQQLMKGDLHWNEFPIVELKKMRKKLKKAGYKADAAYVDAMIKDKEDPIHFLSIKTYDEAFAYLEEVFQTKLRRPEDWFPKEKSGGHRRK